MQHHQPWAISLLASLCSGTAKEGGLSNRAWVLWDHQRNEPHEQTRVSQLAPKDNSSLCCSSLRAGEIAQRSSAAHQRGSVWCPCYSCLYSPFPIGKSDLMGNPKPEDPLLPDPPCSCASPGIYLQLCSSPRMSAVNCAVIPCSFHWDKEQLPHVREDGQKIGERWRSEHTMSPLHCQYPEGAFSGHTGNQMLRFKAQYFDSD